MLTVTAAAEVHGWAVDVARFTDEWPAHGADLVALEVRRTVDADTGGDGQLGKRLGRVSVAVKAQPGVATVSAAGARGAWSILENGTKGHAVKAKHDALKLPFGYRRTVHVSGVKGRRTWSRGVEAGLPIAQRDLEAAFAKAVGG